MTKPTHQVHFLISLLDDASYDRLAEEFGEALSCMGRPNHQFSVERLLSGEVHLVIEPESPINYRTMKGVESIIARYTDEYLFVFDNCHLSAEFMYFVCLKTSYALPGRNPTFEQMRDACAKLADEHGLIFDDDQFMHGYITFIFTSYDQPVPEPVRLAIKDALASVKPFPVIFEH